MAAPDLTVILARTLTLDPDRPEVQAVLVGAGRVLATGTREEVRALAPGARVLDHRDLTLTPGLADAHIHLVGYGFSLSQLPLHGVSSVAQVQRLVQERAAALPEGSWVQGGGFLLSELGLTDFPPGGLLDDAAPRHPVLLYSRDLHLAWANAEALRRANIHAGTPDPDGGQIVRGPDGTPTGILLENACDLLTAVLPAPTDAQTLDAARAGAQDLAARGYVSAHTMAFEGPEAPRALAALAARGELPLRVWACLPHDRLHLARDLGVGPGSGGMFEFGGVKFFADGALGSRTAWLHRPGFADGSGTGIALDSPDVIRERGRAALDLGFVPVTHAIGDRANTEVLNAYDDLRDLAARRGLRLRVEHAQHLRPEDVPRFAGLTVSAQPIHLQADGSMIRALLPHLEGASYAFRSLQAAGALLAFGSDAPVAPPDVQAGFRAAMTRLSDDGLPLAPHEALDVQDVLRAFTRGPALAAGWHDEGIVAPGARAAFTLWDELGGTCTALIP
ncbi:amidohydrolase [Deinococcus aquiradiocola]|uniref:Amidohydrolase n=1 Tax=Deinococcus aquiradiocola TaxID=393059 RepID=A0A917PJC5_9DEIO|nr:amidohydrolase [Deinococcus aquiradiocola]GGJ81660.1 amidohydrolase [Deinococcus aquiradiocola]